MTNHEWARILQALYEGPLFVSEDRGDFDGKDYELVEYLSGMRT